MLIKDLNDTEEACRDLGQFLDDLQPDIAYLSIPTRPPAEKSIRAVEPSVLNMAFQIVADNVEKVEILSGYEGNAFSFTGDVRQDILNITAVHPMRKEAVIELMDKQKSGWFIVEDLLQKGLLIQTEFNGHSFFLRIL